MDKEKKRGQIEISFGFIISIIIIIAIIATAFFTIRYFLGLNECSKTGFFLEDLEEEVVKAYRSSIYQDTFTGTLPSGIEEVCFGNLTQSYVPGYGDEQARLKDDLFRDEWGNKVFLLPLENSCDGDLNSKRLKESRVERFFCVQVEDNEISVRIEKNSRDNLVMIGET